jgi:hypothetical protein
MKPQVRRSPGVPRAVFVGLLRMTPGGLTFQVPSPFDRGSSTYPPLVTRGWRFGTMRLGPP